MITIIGPFEETKKQFSLIFNDLKILEKIPNISESKVRPDYIQRDLKYCGISP